MWLMKENVKLAKRAEPDKIKLLIQEFDELRKVVREADLVEVMEMKYGMSKSQVQHLISRAIELDLLASTVRFGKPGYLKRYTTFASAEED